MTLLLTRRLSISKYLSHQRPTQKVLQFEEYITYITFQNRSNHLLSIRLSKYKLICKMEKPKYSQIGQQKHSQGGNKKQNKTLNNKKKMKTGLLSTKNNGSPLNNTHTRED